MSTCPVACKYCAVTEVSYRAEQWREKWIIGLNKAVTILNPPFDQNDPEAMASFYNFDVELLRGDRVGFNATTDPFWGKYASELDLFLERVPELAKAVICVTKFPIKPRMMRRLAQIPNFLLNVSITGLDSIEKTTTASRLETLRLAKEFGVKAYPVIHPYIDGMSDLSFLPALKECGYDKADIKGFRYDPKMSEWLPAEVAAKYTSTVGTESLPDGSWREQFIDAGIEIRSLRQWVDEHAHHLPSVSREKAMRDVAELSRIGNITSSSGDSDVVDTRVKARQHKDELTQTQE